MDSNFNIDDAFGKLNCTMCGEGTFMCDCDDRPKSERLEKYLDEDADELDIDDSYGEDWE